MRGFSKAILAGNLSRDPELRVTSTGSQACSFTVAVNRAYKSLSTGEMQDSVSFIDCTAWGKPGETIHQYMKKGSPILVSGRIEQHVWDDKTTGQKRSKTEVVVDDFNFLAGNGNGMGSSSSYGGGKKKSADVVADEIVADDMPDDDQIDLDEIPF